MSQSRDNTSLKHSVGHSRVGFPTHLIADRFPTVSAVHSVLDDTVDDARCGPSKEVSNTPDQHAHEHEKVTHLSLLTSW